MSTRSQCSNIVKPMPTADPFTAAMSGLGNICRPPTKASKTWPASLRSESAAAGAAAGAPSSGIPKLISVRSTPPLKTRPAPVNTTTLTASSASASASRGRRTLVQLDERVAFSGRFSVMRRTCPVSSTRTMSGLGVGHARNLPGWPTGPRRAGRPRSGGPARGACRPLQEARERVDTYGTAGPHELLLDDETLVAEGVEVDGHPVEHVLVTDASRALGGRHRHPHPIQLLSLGCRK